MESTRTINLEKGVGPWQYSKDVIFVSDVVIGEHEPAELTEMKETEYAIMKYYEIPGKEKTA